MKILRNEAHRFDIEGINERGRAKPGIAGYKCKALGWILEKIFKKAVAVKTENGTVYLNRKSLEKWLGHVKQEHTLSKDGFEKLYKKKPERVGKALDRILHPKEPKIELFREEEEEESVEEVPELQIVSVEKKPLYDSASIEAFLKGFEDKSVLGDKFDEVHQIYQDFMRFIASRDIELVFVQRVKYKDPAKSPEKRPKAVGYYTWEIPGSELRPLQIGSHMLKTYHETPGKFRTEKILHLAQQMLTIMTAANHAVDEPGVD